MEAGDLYRVDDELATEGRRAMALCENYNALGVDQVDERRRLLEDLLGRIGADAVVRPPFRCDYGRYLSIGARTFANFGLVALDCAPITIGDDVQIGPNVALLTPTHPIDPDLRRAGWEAAQPITIGDNVWLGGGAVVLPGVTIGSDTVVGAGAVVSRDLPQGAVAVGNPARVIRTVSDG
jgi:maltose O-acetyltransferase